MNISKTKSMPKAASPAKAPVQAPKASSTPKAPLASVKAPAAPIASPASAASTASTAASPQAPAVGKSDSSGLSTEAQNSQSGKGDAEMSEIAEALIQALMGNFGAEQSSDGGAKAAQQQQSEQSDQNQSQQLAASPVGGMMGGLGGGSESAMKAQQRASDENMAVQTMSDIKAELSPEVLEAHAQRLRDAQLSSESTSGPSASKPQNTSSALTGQIRGPEAAQKAQQQASDANQRAYYEAR